MKFCAFSKIAENNNMRSAYIFENIIKENNKKSSSTGSYTKIPKIIIQYWDDKDIPEDVKSVMNTWVSSGMGIVIYNRFSAKKFIDKYCESACVYAFEKCTHPAMRADFFRLCYLYEKGGFYVDADNKFNDVELNNLFENNKLKVQPLCYNTKSDQMIDVANFFYATKATSYYIYYMNNDPIVAPPKHPLIELALNRALSRLLVEKDNLKDIQSIAGPGNLSASIVQYFINCQKNNLVFDVELLKDWDNISTPQWNLSYRKDQRNWRIWTGNKM